MTELKLCPFCGGAVTIADYGDYLSIITKGTDPNSSCRCRLFMESEKFAEGDKEARQRAEDSLSEKWNRRFDGWHTGKPTEDGYYLCHFTDGDRTFDACFPFNNGVWDINGYGLNPYTFEVVAWQRIEPYKEENNG